MFDRPRTSFEFSNIHLEWEPHMAERRASLMEPRMEHLLDRVGSKFTLVTLAAMRAREINDYYNQLGEGLGKIVPPQVTSVSRKPLTISLEEIEAGKIEAVPLPEETPEVEGATEAAADEPVAE
jgi:DNA-directed RNA polymerase subunit omega